MSIWIPANNQTETLQLHNWQEQINSGKGGNFFLLKPTNSNDTLDDIKLLLT